MTMTKRWYMTVAPGKAGATQIGPVGARAL
jgi:hypothetical protein